MDEYSGPIGMGELARELRVDVEAVNLAGDAYATEHGNERTYAGVTLPYREYTAEAANAIRAARMNVTVTADDVRKLLAVDYPAVLVEGDFLNGVTTSIMADSTARDRGYRVLLTQEAVYETWGDQIGDDEAEQYAAEMTEQLAR